MTAGLLLTLVGLAVLDSVNVSTIWIVVVILLAAKRPAATGWAYAVGAFVTFGTFTLLLYFGLNAAETWLDGLTLWLRRILFTIITVVFIVLGVRRFTARPRRGYGLPSWVNAWTALPLGLVATISDIPNAFPMFLTVERLIDTGIAPETAVPVLIGYTAIYALPTLAVLIVGLLYHDRLRARLQTLYDRYATGHTKPSGTIAALCFTAAAASLAILIFLIR